MRGSTYQITGKQFNGLSQAASFGDELETSTNYPLVRITNRATHHVFYARTHDHSTMAVATGNATVSTNFDVPAGMETGPSSLEVDGQRHSFQESDHHSELETRWFAWNSPNNQHSHF